jgi:hypothetical protein
MAITHTNGLKRSDNITAITVKPKYTSRKTAIKPKKAVISCIIKPSQFTIY